MKIFLAHEVGRNVISFNKDEIGRNLVSFDEVCAPWRVRVLRWAARDENGKIITFGDFAEILP